MKHLFIVNPIAGKGKALKLIPKIKELFNSEDDYIIEVTQRPGHATEIARSYSNTGNFRVYSVGGDGTLNEVLNGIAGSNCCLGVIPCGSGNDYVRNLIYPKDIDTLLRSIIKSDVKRFDLAKVNDKYFANISSVGFDSEVAYEVIRYKKLPLISGSLAYILGIISTVFKYTGDDLKVYIDGKDVSGRYLLTAVANGKYYGGGMLVAPNALLKDGIFEICMVKKLSRLKILVLFPLLIIGKHGIIKKVSFHQGKKVEIYCDNQITINIDGEVLKANKAIFEIIPMGIGLIIP